MGDLMQCVSDVGMSAKAVTETDSWMRDEVARLEREVAALREQLEKERRFTLCGHDDPIHCDERCWMESIKVYRERARRAEAAAREREADEGVEFRDMPVDPTLAEGEWVEELERQNRIMRGALVKISKPAGMELTEETTYEDLYDFWHRVAAERLNLADEALREVLGVR